MILLIRVQFHFKIEFPIKFVIKLLIPTLFHFYKMLEIKNIFQIPKETELLIKTTEKFSTHEK